MNASLALKITTDAYSKMTIALFDSAIEAVASRAALGFSDAEFSVTHCSDEVIERTVQRLLEHGYTIEGKDFGFIRISWTKPNR